jgi:sugar transferase (PEP-CTERM system associated)
MPTATINSTTWEASSSQPRKPWLTIRPYYLVRPGRVLLPVAIACFVAALARAVHQGGNMALPAFFASGGLVLLYMSYVRRAGRPRVPSHHSMEVYFAVSAAVMLVIPAGHGMPSTILNVGAALMPLALAPAVPRLTSNKKRLERVLIVGDGDVASKLCQALESDGSLAYLPVSISGTQSAEGFLVDYKGLDEIVERDNISRVVVAEQHAETRRKVATALVDLRLRGLEVNDAVDFYEQMFGKIWIDVLSSEWFVYTSGFRHSKGSVLLKRCMDVIVSLVLLILTAPVMLAVAIAIRLDSPGPVLFRQTRVGLFGKQFTIYKFRSMRSDAEAKLGPRWAQLGDTRVTRVGRLIRKFRLDEIPQAWNVLRGEMSIVGPRPERPCFVEQLSQNIPFYDLRHYVKPGITGWAQVKYRYGASIEDAYQKLQYDIYYAKHRSFFCDMKVLYKTIAIVVFARGI